MQMLFLTLLSFKKVKLISGHLVYAPTSDYEDEAVEKVYKEVSKAKEESNAEYTILMGDFNAKIGKCQPGEEAIMGKFEEKQ